MTIYYLVVSNGKENEDDNSIRKEIVSEIQDIIVAKGIVDIIIENEGYEVNSFLADADKRFV